MVDVCAVCKKVVSTGNRRTLNPHSNHTFFQRNTALPEPGPRCFVCWPCFAKAEKSVQSALYFLNSLRSSLGVPSVSNLCHPRPLQLVIIVQAVMILSLRAGHRQVLEGISSLLLIHLPVIVHLYRYACSYCSILKGILIVLIR